MIGSSLPRLRSLALAVATCSTLAGCSNISGLGGVSEFECKAPKGVPCMSMSGVYANIRSGNVPGLNESPSGAPTLSNAVPAQSDASSAASHSEPTQAGEGWNPFSQSPRVALQAPAPLATAQQAQPGAFGRVSPTTINVPASGTPLRTPERVLRIWIAPLEDAEGTLHDQRYVYVQVDRGQWLLQAFQESGRQRYAPVKRPGSSSERSDTQPQGPNDPAQEAARRNAVPFTPGSIVQPRPAEPPAEGREQP